MHSNQPVLQAGSNQARARAAARFLLAVTLVATFLVYAPTLGYEFVSDDRYQIAGNPYVQSWHFLPRYFAGHAWSWAGLTGPASNYYRPVFLLWLRLNHAVFGLDALGWHFTTLVTHLLATLLVYRLAENIAGDRLSAGLAALAFGLHPIHVESVAWVSGITDSLPTLLVLMAFLCYRRRQEDPQRATAWWAVSVVFYALALLAKEIAVVLPVLVFADELLIRGGTEQISAGSVRSSGIRSALWGVAPHLVLTADYALARAFALRGLVHPEAGVRLSTVAFTAPSLLWFYFKHLVWPVRLYAQYDLSAVNHPGLVSFLVPALGVAGVFLALGLWSKRSRAAAFAAAWLLLPIIPALDVQVLPQGNFAHDRFLYLPSVGFSILAALALRSVPVGRARLFGFGIPQSLALAALASLMATGTLLQSRYWKNDLAFSYHTVEGTPNSLMAENGVAFALAERGRFDEAFAVWQRVLDRDPKFSIALYNLGYYHYRLGRFPEAERYLGRAIQVNPSDPYPVLCLGLTRFKMGHLDEAEAAMRRALELRPEGFGFHFALGFSLKTRGDRVAALKEFKTELANNPANQAARDQIREIETGAGSQRSDGPEVPSLAP